MCDDKRRYYILREEPDGLACADRNTDLLDALGLVGALVKAMLASLDRRGDGLG